MGQAVIVADGYRDFLRKTSGKAPVRAFVLRRTAPEQNELHVRREHFFQCTELNINPLLVRQTADVAEERFPRCLRQSEFTLERKLASLFPRSVLQGIRV